MTKRFKKILGTAGALAASLLISWSAAARPSQAATPMTDFSAVPVFSNDNQISHGVGYYDLGLKAGQVTKIKFKMINNNASASNKLTAKLVQGSTSDAGAMQYVAKGFPKDNTLKYPFTQLASINGKNSITETLAPGKDKTYTVTLRMPSQKFDGAVSGAIVVTKGYDDDKSAGVANQVTYALPVYLEEGKVQLPDLKLNKINAGVYNARRAVSVNLQNYKPSSLSQGALSARVTKRGQSKTLKSLTLNQQSMAPNSNFNFKIPWGEDNFAPGDYTLYLTYKSNDSKFGKTKTWNFVKNFHISIGQAGLANYQTTRIPWWVWAIIWALIILIVALIVYLIYKNRKKKREEEADEF